jgi:hypothetical protein
MPRIRCAYEGCVYLEGDFCGAEEIDLDLDEGCLTFTQIEDLALEDEDWEEELFGEEDEEDHFDEDDDDDYDPSEWN